MSNKSPNLKITPARSYFGGGKNVKIGLVGKSRQDCHYWLPGIISSPLHELVARSIRHAPRGYKRQYAALAEQLHSLNEEIVVYALCRLSVDAASLGKIGIEDGDVAEGDIRYATSKVLRSMSCSPILSKPAVSTVVWPWSRERKILRPTRGAAGLGRFATVDYLCRKMKSQSGAQRREIVI